MPARVALASAKAAWGIDPDEPGLLEALEEAGVAAEPAAWDDDAVDWAGFDLVVLRSTWDYAERREEFLDWLDGVARVTRVENPPEIVRANTDKRYLDMLAMAGVPVVPTRFVEPGQDLEPLPDRPFVVKPSVSAGSRDTLRCDAGEHRRPAALARRVHGEGRTVMVQPYVASVDHRGETALCFIDGAFSHAIAKGAILAPGSDVIEGLHAPEQLTSRTASGAERTVAEAALPALGARDLLYARVDVVDDDHGAPSVLEVELTEPSLFLRMAPGAAQRFARAIAGRARRGVRTSS